MTHSLAQELAARAPDLRGRLEADAPLAPFTWFRVGGPAEALFVPADADDLAYLLARKPPDVPVHVLGLASNTLVRDGGIGGLVIRLAGRGFGAAVVEGEARIRAGAGLADKRLAVAARDAGIGGLEFYFGIPGSIGGALRMNAGANGTETTDRLVSARAITPEGELVTLSHAEMGFSYRNSAASADLIFVDALFEGRPDTQAAIQARMDAVQAHREAAQPIRDKTGGSTFKNPAGHSAWKLVDAAGCRGLRVGGAQVSEKHCNFLINAGDASAHDLETLGETVRRRVHETSGILLDWEIKRVGVWVPGAAVEVFVPPNAA